jgi:hypothetical protein
LATPSFGWSTFLENRVTDKSITAVHFIEPEIPEKLSNETAKSTLKLAKGRTYSGKVVMVCLLSDITATDYAMSRSYWTADPLCLSAKVHKTAIDSLRKSYKNPVPVLFYTIMGFLRGIFGLG